MFDFFFSTYVTAFFLFFLFLGVVVVMVSDGGLGLNKHDRTPLAGKVWNL